MNPLISDRGSTASIAGGLGAEVIVDHGGRGCGGECRCRVMYNEFWFGHLEAIYFFVSSKFRTAGNWREAASTHFPPPHRSQTHTHVRTPASLGAAHVEIRVPAKAVGNLKQGRIDKRNHGEDIVVDVLRIAVGWSAAEHIGGEFRRVPGYRQRRRARGVFQTSRRGE